MKQERRTPQYTTRWEDMPVVRARLASREGAAGNRAKISMDVWDCVNR
jgi:hypothetical protein